LISLDIVPDFGNRIRFVQCLTHDLSRRYYGYPVYLVGGALRDLPNEPRDFDLVIVLPDDAWRSLYYGSYDDWRAGRNITNECWLRWARDCAKQSEEMSTTYRTTFDIRTQHEEMAKLYADKPRLRLSKEIIPNR